jgi:transposase
MMGANRRKFDGAFKREAVRLADSTGKKDRTIEKELGVYQGSLRHWRKELKADTEHAFPGTGHLKPLEEELRRVKKERDIFRKERDILKKGVAIFSKKPKMYTDL